MGCKKAQGFLEQAEQEVAARTDARKEKRGRQEALALAKSVSTVVVGKGKKIVTFDMKQDPPDDDTLAAALLGPSGNLKAPTFRKGSTLVVGFSAEAYKQVLGTR
jgi:arsenate reductase-like glutaredoxin family protein